MNIVQLLDEREKNNSELRCALENSLEDSFLAGNAEQFDNAMPRAVSSTIAIAMACDGLTFATTHGDHTVKVFDFASGEQIRNFSGHPRTPWTLKYHPLDPNIVASGCLGFQVRVWDIKADVCLNLIIYSQTIISLAFHPKGEFIAVASGMRIEMWEWQISLDHVHQVSRHDTDTKFAVSSAYMRPENEDDVEMTNFCRGISHKRNVRAVLFHPSGDYIFAVAPDSPKQNNEDLAHCRLYACEFQALFQVDRTPRWGSVLELPAPPTPIPSSGATMATPEKIGTHAHSAPLWAHIRSPGENSRSPPSYEEDRDDGEGGEIPLDDNSYVLPLKLTSCRVLIPQIHLYSDGGIDISRDGRYLFTCARVHIPPFFYAEPLVGMAGKSIFSAGTSPKSHPARVVADDAENGLMNKLPPAVAGMPPRKAPGAPPTGLVRPPTPPLFVAQNRRHLRSASGSEPLVHVSCSKGNSTSASPLPGSLASAPSPTTTPPGKSQGFTGIADAADLSEAMEGLTLSGQKDADGVPLVIDMVRRRGLVLAPQPRKVDALEVEVGTRTGGSAGKGLAAATSCGGVRQLACVSQRRVTPHQRQRLVRMGDRPPSGWAVEDHLCLFELNFQSSGSIMTPTLVNSKQLPGALTKAVTSTKLSASCRYALIGYGVRVGGQVQDHPLKHAACEVVCVGDEQMTTAAVMCDFEDEVNIAQFHPFPGHGIVYGTKRGKVRTFSKS